MGKTQFLGTTESIKSLINRLGFYCKLHKMLGEEGRTLKFSEGNNTLRVIFDSEMALFTLIFKLNSDIQNRSTTEVILSLLPEDPNNITDLQAFDDYDGFELKTKEKHYTDRNNPDGQPMIVTIIYKPYR